MIAGRYSGVLRKRSGVAIGGCCCCEEETECNSLGEITVHCFPKPEPGYTIKAMCLRHVIWCNRRPDDNGFSDTMTTDDHDYVIRNARGNCPNGPAYIPYRPVVFGDCVDANPATSLNSNVDLSALDASVCTLVSKTVALAVSNPVTFSSDICRIFAWNATSGVNYTLVMAVEAFRWAKYGDGGWTYGPTSKLIMSLYRMKLSCPSGCFDQRAADMIGTCA